MERPITSFFQPTSSHKKRPAETPQIDTFAPSPKKGNLAYQINLSAPEPRALKSGRTNLWILRNDLRIKDNPALHAATTQGDANVIAVYFWSPQIWTRHNIGPPRIDFIRRSLITLSDVLWNKWKIPLLIRTIRNTSTLIDALQTLIADYRIDAMYLNAEYELNERNRDAKLQETFPGRIHVFHDQCIVPPHSMNSSIVVYNQMKNLWLSIVRSQPERYLTYAELPSLNIWSGAHPQPDVIPDNPSPLKDVQKSIPELWPAGEEEAHRRLELFALGEMAHYIGDRNSPSKDMTSKISPYLAIGTISARHCVNRALLSIKKEICDVELFGSGAGRWISEVIWRDFYRFIMFHHPRICKYQPFVDFAKHIQWRDDPDQFAAWTQGKTGYPIVDAAMRQLLVTGWMHNRVRMLVASFLSKHLLIDWRKGEKWFSEHLIDIDLASNNGGWQWSSSVGVDPHEWIRVMNPILQSEKVDPQGTFIRLWLPELRQCGKDNKVIHDPCARRGETFVRSIGYVKPVVDHKVARARALAAFKEAKEVYSLKLAAA